MPLYEYFCPKCASTFELLRPMSRSDEPGTCPKGHSGGARTLSVFAATPRGGSAVDVMEATPGSGCACGGGGCGCGH